MIGVIANPEELPFVREFFELFKTPWELYRGGTYDVLLCTVVTPFPAFEAKLTVIYSGSQVPYDVDAGLRCSPFSERPRMLRYQGAGIPVYGDSLAFQNGGGALVDATSDAALIASRSRAGGTVVRIGYDLFAEFRTVLTMGQPAVNAAIPTLDLHIAILRHLILATVGALIEIPPVPAGYRFIACLTHDLDHPAMRPHFFDSTLLGFLGRATVGSFVRAVQGRLSWRGMLRNWGTALKAPLIQAGLADDPWRAFVRYPELEKGHMSTFFVIPFKNRPGRTVDGAAPGRRACCYSLGDIDEELRCLMAKGCEIGLHGIDAWLDGEAASNELETIRRFAPLGRAGVRMHWLYYSDRSPAVLEAASADYDSTAGYNETVGYRAGTTQVFKPPDVERLLELPLHIMDTALFFPSRLNLTPSEAARRVRPLLKHAFDAGGCITVNWHDRSIAPERLWIDFYRHLVRELERRGAWFATGSQAVAWFRMRRAAVFESGNGDPGAMCANSARESDGLLPGLQFRVHRGLDSYRDIPLGEACAAR